VETIATLVTTSLTVPLQKPDHPRRYYVHLLVLTQRFDSLRLLKVPPLTLVTYLTLLERHYRPYNSYHNSTHAADVVQSAFVLLGHAALQVCKRFSPVSVNIHRYKMLPPMYLFIYLFITEIIHEVHQIVFFASEVILTHIMQRCMYVLTF